MCGIAGILDFGGDALRFAGHLAAMQRSLKHRGPDDQHHCFMNAMAMAHTRLSIIGGVSGRQPLFNEDRNICLVANGEIYSYQLLRKQLESQGHRFHSGSDCETIIHLYEQYGTDCVGHLEGMFAFALWDAAKQILLLARDRFGIKPLYFARFKDGISFASEATALVGSGLFEKRIDAQAIYDYLAFSFVPGSMCIFRQVEKLQPAERIIFHNGDAVRERYWHPKAVTVPLKKPEAVRELAWRLEKSVVSHLVSDVPVAAFLSGGVDSSTVVAMAQKQSVIDTFCVSFQDASTDEAPFARRVARHLGTRHHEIAISMKPARLLGEAVGFMDEPFADSSALPTFAVCRAARDLVKVVLSGDGGDEVFGGYTGRYRVAALKAAVPRPQCLADILRRVPPWRNGKRSSLPHMLDLAALPEMERYLVERQITTATQRAALMGDEAARDGEPVLRRMAEAAISHAIFPHPVHRALWADLQTSLTDDMLTKVDRMSMAHGLEVRVPLLDHHLVEFTLSLPPGWLVSPLPIEGKRLLRDSVRPLLPPGALGRPKQGFVIPLNGWLRKGLLGRFGEECLSPASRVAAWVDRDAMAGMQQHPLAETPRQDLYALLVLEQWLRRWDP
jgi:asparagine synthase (glutamine-hydrolysing)